MGYSHNFVSHLSAVDIIPTWGRSRSIETRALAHQQSAVSNQATEHLKALSSAAGLPTSAEILAGFGILLHRYSGQSVIDIFCCGLDGETESFLCISLDLSGEPSFRDALERLADAIRVARRRPIPLNAGIEMLTHGSESPVNVTFALGEPIATPTNVELALGVDPGGPEVGLTLAFDSSLYEPAMGQAMVDHLLHILGDAAQRPDLSIDRLVMLGETEQTCLLRQWAANPTPYPRELCIHELFARQVELRPDAPAILYGAETINYRQLDSAANRLAHRLIACGVAVGDPVGVCLPRGPAFVTACLAILKAGGAYVPLDPDYPVERLNLMADDSRAGVVVCDGETRNRLAPCASRVILPNEAATDGIQPPGAPMVTVAPESAAYILYTSGSTGRPKGVVGPHRGIVRLVCSVSYVELTPAETILQYSSTSFDGSTFEIWGALLTGGRLAFPLPDSHGLRGLAESVARYQVTTLLLTPALLNIVVDSDATILRGVRQLVGIGEVMSPQHTARGLAALPGCRIINGYGPTENTTFTSCHTINIVESGRSIPIGRPIENSTVYIVDNLNSLVPIGVPGELLTGGDGLAIGYLNRDELTAERFVYLPGRQLGFDHDDLIRLYRTGDRARWRPDGVIEFLGRADRQFKLRGFRIEPGEIEAVLSEHSEVSQAVVAVVPGEGGTPRLVGYVVLVDRKSQTLPALRSYLASRLPCHMVPTDFVLLSELPRTASGKVDSAALPGLPRRKGGHDSFAGTDRQWKLKALFAQALNHGDIVPDISFFDLGGDSLSLMMLLFAIEKEFSRQLIIEEVIKNPTLNHIDHLLDAIAPSQASGLLMPLRPPTGTRPPLVVAYGLEGFSNWSQNILANLPNAISAVGFRSPGVERIELAPPTLEAMARQCVKDLKWIQPMGPYYIAGHSFGGRLAFEIAQQLIDLGDAIGLLVVLDTQIGINLLDHHDPLKHWSALEAHNYNAFDRYAAKPFPGRIVFIRSTEWLSTFYVFPDGGWSDLAEEGVEIIEVQDSHWGMVNDSSGTTANILHDLLNRASATAVNRPRQRRLPAAGSAAAYRLEALQAYADRDNNRAFDCLRAALEMDANPPPRVYLSLGRQAQVTGRTAEFKQMISSVSARAQQDAVLAFALGQIMIEHKDWESACRFTDWAAVSAPDVATVHHMRAVAFNGLGDRAQAITSACRALELSPRNPDFQHTVVALMRQPRRQ